MNSHPLINQTKKSLRLVGYEVDNVRYWIATTRLNLSAEQIAEAYNLRWNIETYSVYVPDVESISFNMT